MVIIENLKDRIRELSSIAVDNCSDRSRELERLIKFQTRNREKQKEVTLTNCRVAAAPSVVVNFGVCEEGSREALGERAPDVRPNQKLRTNSVERGTGV